DVVPAEQVGRRLVEGDGQDERLAGVPEQGERFAGQAAAEDPAEGLVQRVRRHPPGGLTVGEVAVRAVDVAERGRLQDQQLQRARDDSGGRRGGRVERA